MTKRTVYLKDVPFDEAWQSFRSALDGARRWEPVEGENVPLEEALGRITAEPIWARISSPHYHAAAMDGYALRAADSVEASDRSPTRLSNKQIDGYM